MLRTPERFRLSCLDPIKRLSRWDDRYALVLLQVEQIAIARDDEISPGSHRAGEHGIIIRIGTDGLSKGWRFHHVHKTGVLVEHLCRSGTARSQNLGELTAIERPGEFLQQGGAGKNATFFSRPAATSLCGAPRQSRAESTTLVSRTSRAPSALVAVRLDFRLDLFGAHFRDPGLGHAVGD